MVSTGSVGLVAATVVLVGVEARVPPAVTLPVVNDTGVATLSGYTSGALPGDSGWVVRGEFGRAFVIPIESGALTVTPYAFAATGERIFWAPTALEVGDIHASNYGAGARFNLTPWNNFMPDAYSFV